MEFPPIDEFAYKVAEKALDEITYGGKTIREWINILAKQQPCDDAISRQAALEIQANYAEYIGATKFWQMLDNIRALPPVTPQPKTGRWIKVTNGRGGHECDLCHEYAPSYQSGKEYLTKYCPNCGAKMEVEE